MITPPLLGRFPDAKSMAKAEPEEIFEYIKSCSYPNNKAKHLSGMSRMLVSEFGSIVPSDPLLLQKLPGVGRKTANVIASVVFQKPVMAVDTHVFRVSNRIGLVRNAQYPQESGRPVIEEYTSSPDSQSTPLAPSSRPICLQGQAAIMQRMRTG